MLILSLDLVVELSRTDVGSMLTVQVAHRYELYLLHPALLDLVQLLYIGPEAFGIVPALRPTKFVVHPSHQCRVRC